MKKGKFFALDPILHTEYEDRIHNGTNFINKLYELITQSIEPPFSLSIDGLWGTGKTTLMKMLEKKLIDNQYSTFWFNPWEYQQTENVILAFLQNLAAKHKDKINNLEKSGGKIFKVLLTTGISTALNLITQGNVSLKDIESDLKQTETAQKKSFEFYQNSIETVKDEFNELIDKISSNNSDKSYKPVIIFFDDFDRCLPENAIQLLEALKNLFLTPSCNCIFICGIDTRVAKQFICKYYDELPEAFAIDYFRKIFNLTISMPFGSSLNKLLTEYVKYLYGTDESSANIKADIIYTAGNQAEISSVRKYLNIINNFYLFQKFNPECTSIDETECVIHFLILKESWQPLYELLVTRAYRENTKTMAILINDFLNAEEYPFTKKQRNFLTLYFINKNSSFSELSHNTKLADFFSKYSTLT